MMQINGPCNWHIIMYDIIRLLKLTRQFKQHLSFAGSWGKDILTTFCTIKNTFLFNGSQPLGRPETINGMEKNKIRSSATYIFLDFSRLKILGEILDNCTFLGFKRWFEWKFSGEMSDT